MKTLVTGADGYLGRTIVEHLLATSDDEVVACVRARSERELAAKRGVLQLLFGRDMPRIRVEPLDLGAARLELSVEARQVERVIHTAAATAFDVEREHAQAVNVDGTARVCELARRCARLRRFALISSVYASGLRSGEILEEPLDSVGFANHYEWSKWAAEDRLARDYSDLPWQIHRVGTVLCHDDSGSVAQINVAHKIWRLLFLGLLPVVPGNPDTPLHVVSGEFAARAICELSQRAPEHSVAHVCSSAGELTLQGFLDGAFEHFAGQEHFRRRRVLKPLFTDEASFYALADTVGMFSQDALRHVAALMRPFAKQGFVHKRVRGDRLARLSLLPPDGARLVPKCCAHLLRADWAERGSA